MKRKGTSGSGIRDYLLSLSKKELATLILKSSAGDAVYLNELLLKKAKKATEPEREDSLKDLLQRTIVPKRRIFGYGATAYAHDAYDAIFRIRFVIDDGKAREAMELCEFAIKKVNKAYGYVDDSYNGCLSGMMKEIEDIYLDACTKANPDRAELGRKLFKMHTENEIDIFYKAAKRFAAVLGDAGLKSFKESAKAAWDALTEAEQKDSYGKAFKIKYALLDLAEMSGDFEEQIKLKSIDLSAPYSYLEVAQIYEKAGNRKSAIEWAENGIKNFPKFQDSRVKDFLAELYVKEKRISGAVQLAWENYEQSPGPETFAALKKYSDMSGVWNEYRQKAMGLLNQRIESEKNRVYGVKNLPYREHNGKLVEILLWEKKEDEAWDAALQGGCYEHIWQKLADARFKKHPMDTVYAYKQIINTVLLNATKYAYKHAVSYIKDIKSIMMENRKENDYTDYMAGLREKHRAKKSFIAMLDKKKL